MTTTNPFTASKSHQTVTIVEVAATAGPRFRQRAARFVESLNRTGTSPNGTIKSDVWSLDVETGKLTKGLVFPDATPETSVPTHEQLRQAADEAGYVQVAIVGPVTLD